MLIGFPISVFALPFLPIELEEEKSAQCHLIVVERDIETRMYVYECVLRWGD